MKLLDERGIGTVWSICKEKFALVGHTHNYAGSGSPGGSANSAIGVVDYNQTGKTIQIGYSGTGITGDQIKYIAGYTDGSGNVNAKIKDVSKDALKSWLGLGSLAYSSSSIPTKLSQLNNDKGFVTGSVSGNTVTINGASTTWTNTWRGIQDNLTSSSTSDSLSANQGSILKELIDTKADSRDLSSYAHKSDAVKNISSIINKDLTGYGEQILKITYASNSLGEVKISDASNNSNGFMSISDKQKLDNIADFANNYTLPAASNTTLGGIKTSYVYVPGDSWPIYVAPNNEIYTRISGLHPVVADSSTGIESIDIKGKSADTITTYSSKEIIFDSEQPIKKPIKFPSKSGTFALLSDIPDVSNLCKFNFIDSISECQNGKINYFLNRDFGSGDIDLKEFENCEEGTILFLSIYSQYQVGITNSQNIWYMDMRSKAVGSIQGINSGAVILITIKSGAIYAFKIS